MPTVPEAPPSPTVMGLEFHAAPKMWCCRTAERISPSGSLTVAQTVKECVTLDGLMTGMPTLGGLLVMAGTACDEVEV